MKKILILIVGLFGVLSGIFAVQRDTLNVPLLNVSDTTVVHYEQNVLKFPAGHELFDELYQGLTGLSKGKTETLRVMHIGGSHVQAGAFSGRMRKNLSVFNDGRPVGRGLIFPYGMMGTNGPRDVSFSHEGSWSRTRCVEANPTVPLGLAGAAITTADSMATITLTMPIPVEQLTVLGHTTEDEALFPILIEGTDTLYPPMYSELIGYDFLLTEPSKTCRIGFAGKRGGKFSLRGFLCDADGTGLVYSESGINGAAVPSWLKCEMFQDELTLLAPNLVIFAIGINDANISPTSFSPESFKQNYRMLIDRIRQVNPRCAFIFVTNNDCYLNIGRRKSYNTNTQQVEQAFFDLAREYKGAVWNLFRVMGGFSSSSKWVQAGLMQKDHVHFTGAGYQMLGDLLYNAIVTDYRNLPVEQQIPEAVINRETQSFFDESELELIIEN